VAVLLVSSATRKEPIAGDDMFLIPTKTSWRCNDEPDRRDRAFAPLATAPVTAETFAALLRYLKSASPHAAFTRSARSRNPIFYSRKLRRRTKASTNDYPTKTDRRKPCATARNVFRIAQVSGARSATEGLASSGITPGEPRSVQRGAPIDSRSVERMIAGFYLGFGPPNRGSANISAAGSPLSRGIAQ
jgi:hypothetical protein